MNNLTRAVRRRRVQAAAIALLTACGSFSAPAAVRVPEDEPEWNLWLLPPGNVFPAVDVNGQASGMSTPASDVPAQTSVPRVPFRRGPMPAAAKSSVELFARQVNNEKPIPVQTVSVDEDTNRPWFALSQNCRRFELVCLLIGIP